MGYVIMLTYLPYQFLMETPRPKEAGCSVGEYGVRSNFRQAMEELCCAVSKKLQPPTHAATVHLRQRLHITVLATTLVTTQTKTGTEDIRNARVTVIIDTCIMYVNEGGRSPITKIRHLVEAGFESLERSAT